MSDNDTTKPPTASSRPSKHIFVTGGVSSALGKGITAASLGTLLTARGLKVTLQKLDPYINVDPGTMNPFEHGEVFVTHDGGETDLDLGHYERFVDVELPRGASVSSGQIWQSVIAKERRGDYLGKTVQVVPHITDEIKRRILDVADGYDVVIHEVGGTVGDIEGLPFLEAIRHLRRDLGRDRVCYVHVALVPYVAAAGELKTKPAQHSVRELRSIGITPDVLVLRADRDMDSSLKRKIALQCDVDVNAVIAAVDQQSLYDVPLAMQQEGLDRVVTNIVGISAPDADMTTWTDMVRRAHAPSKEVTIAMVGKYIDLQDAYLSVVESLNHAGIANDVQVAIKWVAADVLDPESVERELAGVDGVLVPGGFGGRGIEGKLAACGWARKTDTPFLGICLGLQCAVIEFARNVIGLDDANSAEWQPDTTNPVVHLMPSQHDVEEKGGTMRLGNYAARLTPGTRVAEAYGAEVVYERHRHRFEVNNRYREAFDQAGLVIAGVSPDDRLVEFIELRDHPYYVATQAHPEFRSRPNRPHPLFDGLVAAALQRHEASAPAVASKAAAKPEEDIDLHVQETAGQATEW